MAQLPKMTKLLARNIVAEALRKVASFQSGADFKQFTFQYFTVYHKSMFLAALKLATNSVKSDERFCDVALDPDNFSTWPTVQDCVDYVYSQSSRVPASTNLVKLP